MSAFAELRSFLAHWHAELRRCGQFAHLLDVECAEEIAAEERATVEKIRAMAHRAEVHDLEAAKLLRQALVDGLDKSDLPAVRRALALLERSAREDHEISEVACA